MKTPKVFGIGFHKTGTTSFKRALQVLGYRVAGPNAVKNPNIAQAVHAMAYRIAENYDAFQDNPWPLLYREMDERYPGSKFILTVRPEDDWIKSVVRHFGSATTPMRKWIYGVGAPLGNEDIYLARYRRHNADVIAYFSTRPDDLLVFDITGGGGWSELCRFLGHGIPAEPFPHANRALSGQGERRPGST